MRRDDRGPASQGKIVIPLPRSGLHCGFLVANLADVPGHVIPLPRSGLHCGGDILSMQIFAVWSSRSQGAGSIAARSSTVGTFLGTLVIPLPRSGLHCGRSASSR